MLSSSFLTESETTSTERKISVVSSYYSLYGLTQNLSSPELRSTCGWCSAALNVVDLSSGELCLKCDIKKSV